MKLMNFFFQTLVVLSLATPSLAQYTSNTFSSSNVEECTEYDENGNLNDCYNYNGTEKSHRNDDEALAVLFGVLLGGLIIADAVHNDERCEVGLFNRRGRMRQRYVEYGPSVDEACRKAMRECRYDRIRRQSCEYL